MRIGTAHFVSFNTALRYYEPYGLTAEDVDRKLAAGEIFLGVPKLKPGETVAIIDEGARYAIITAEP